MKKIIISLSLAVVILVASAYYWELNKKENRINLSTSISQEQAIPAPESENKTNTSGWKEYSDDSIQFEYPDNVVSVIKKGNKVSLNHSLNYRHNDFCDLKGDGTVLEKFTDFDVSLRVIDKNIKGSLDETQGWLAKDYFVNGTFKLSPGFVDKFSVGNLNGYQITSGVEGCGNYTYYFSLGPTKTLVVFRAFIPELNSINANNKIYLNLPGVIDPNEEKEFFTKILSSLKIK